MDCLECLDLEVRCDSKIEIVILPNSIDSMYTRRIELQNPIRKEKTVDYLAA